MIISWNWLSQYVRLDMSAEELVERLAMAGFNHEGTDELGGDLAIDVEVTSNRPDCLCHIGVAREVGVLYDRPAAVADSRPAETGAAVASITSVSVTAPELCPLFTARVVSGARIGGSPWWMQKRLATLGINSISNVVDITNYVMFECGQPLHAYDLDKLHEHRLVVRPAAKGETLQAINGRTYELTPEMLTIADAGRPVGLAGVMGGLDTEIGPETRNILIEAAIFDPDSVRRTSRALGLASPSSFRFERGLDRERTDWASRRCAELILELAGGRLHPGVIQVGTPDRERPKITLRFAQVERVLGISIPRERMLKILSGLGLEQVETANDRASFVVPSWRGDLEREIDLVEEVARVHGYEHIPENRSVPLTNSARGARERVEAEVRGSLTALGFDEAYTYSLVAEPLDAGLMDGSNLLSLKVDHSSRKKESALRRGLVPSLLEARAFNEAHGAPDADLFEIANVYLSRPGQSLPDQPTQLAFVGGCDFPALKGVVEQLRERLHISGPIEARPVARPLLVEGKSAELFIEGRHLATIGEVAPEWSERLDLRAKCGAGEVCLDLLVELADLVPRFRHLPGYPAITRDLSLVVDRTLPWSQLAGVVHRAAGSSLESLTFLDTFESKDIPAGRHSLHFGLCFRHPERTLTGEEVELTVSEILAACRARFGATLRG
jgi:phenylalanyl-tRNA synthetase beta chain